MIELHRQIGDLLVDGGFATRRQVNAALRKQRFSRKHLADILLEQGMLVAQERDAVLRLQDAMMDGQLDISHVREVLEHRGEVVGSLDEIVHARLGELLLEHGDISERQLEQGLKEQRRTGEYLGKILVRLGFAKQSDVQRSHRLQRQLAAAACGAMLTFMHAAAAAGPVDNGAGMMLADSVPMVAAAASGTGVAGSSSFNNIIKPLSSKSKKSVELRDARDPALQEALEEAVERMNVGHAVDQKRLAMTLVDITDIENPRMASVNGDHMLYAASLPKIAILLGAFEKIEQGGMQLTPDVEKELTRMIRRSSNTAATNMYNAVGPKFLAKTLQSEKYQLYDAEHNGGLWVGKPYGKGGAWKRDPLHNISHGATALQVARFLYMMERGELASPEASKKIKQMMGDPGIQHKFVKGLNNARPGSEIFRKSGTWRTYHSDCAVVERDGRRYIAVAMADSSKGGQWLPEMIVKMDDMVFKGSKGITVAAR